MQEKIEIDKLSNYFYGKGTMNILALIPARGGSKSIPYKNIYPVLGKPLLAYTIDAAKKSRLINRIIVSTDDKKIAAVAKKYGAEVPFMRPRALGQDHTPDLPVFQHALTWLKKNEGYTPDFIIHLWPTSPLRKSEDLDEAIRLLTKHPKADSLRSVTITPETPFKMWRIDKGTYLSPILAKEYPVLFKKTQPYILPRQTLPKVYVQTGYIAVIRPHVIMKKNSMCGTKIIPFPHDANLYTELDSRRDLGHTEYILKQFYNKKK